MPASSAAQFALLPNFALFIFAGSVTPGPNNIIIRASGTNFGIRCSLPHLSGLALGFAFMLAAVGLGLGAVFLANPSLQTAMRVAGLAHSDGPRAGRRRGRPVTSDLRAGSAVSVGQPEGMDAGDRRRRCPHRVGEAMLLVVPVLALICVVVNLPSDAIWLVLGVGLRRLLARRRRCAASTSPRRRCWC